MNLLDRFRAAVRAFVLGPAVVERFDEVWGHSIEQYAPAEYGEYIATSNGVYACATSRAQLLSSLPLKLYRLDRAGRRAEVTAGDLYGLLQNVNPFWTGNRLIEMTELSLCLWGQAFWFLERGESGRQPPREIWWGRPDRVRVIPDPVNYIKGFLYTPTTGVLPIGYDPGEVIWFRYPNPNDEYAPLSPLAAVRLAADYATAAVKSNRNLFENGIQAGGFISPKAGTTFESDQAEDLERALERRFKGVDKAHRWGVFRFEAQVQPSGFTPKEAEFLGGITLALEDIARAYKWPLDLIGGRRTYENVDAAMKAAWTNCVLPEGRFISTDLTEQLLPLFPGQADLAEFDASGVPVLHEAEAAEWTRAKEKIQVGALLVNEWRESRGQKALPWGDVWWAPAGAVPIASAERPSPPEPAPEPGPGAAAITAPARRAVEFGSEAHRALWDRFVARAAKQEQRLGKAVAELLRRQQESVLAKLKSERARANYQMARDVTDAPFDLDEWIRKFREAVRPILRDLVRESGDAALDDLALAIAFDVLDPRVVRFLERRAQRFAREVNETTWSALKESLAEGIEAGESVEDLAARVEGVMGDRIASSGETIARTEVIGASNGATLEAWQQSGVVDGKEWLAALDDRTRDTHRAAHGQVVGLDENFEVGDATGPAPGQMGAAEEDINCRCTMLARLS